MGPASKNTKRPSRQKLGLEAELGQLYGRTLDEFVSQRDALAKRLRESGERNDATAVGRLRRPSVSAWAVNQAVRDDPKAAKRLIDAGEQLEAAQVAVMRGSDRAGLRDAMAEEQGAVEEIADAAEAALKAAGRASAATLNRVRKTLRAVAGDQDLGEELAQGRLTNDRVPVGFGAASATPAPTRRSDSKRDSDAKRRSAASAEQKRRQAAERAVRSAKAKLDAASKRVAAAQTKLDRAQTKLDDAGEKLDAAARERRLREDELAAAKDAV